MQAGFAVDANRSPFEQEKKPAASSAKTLIVTRPLRNPAHEEALISAFEAQDTGVVLHLMGNGSEHTALREMLRDKREAVTHLLVVLERPHEMQYDNGVRRESILEKEVLREAVEAGIPRIALFCYYTDQSLELLREELESDCVGLIAVNAYSDHARVGMQWPRCNTVVVPHTEFRVSATRLAQMFIPSFGRKGTD